MRSLREKNRGDAITAYGMRQYGKYYFNKAGGGACTQKIRQGEPACINKEQRGAGAQQQGKISRGATITSEISRDMGRGIRV
jgi:hypothetical protein